MKRALLCVAALAAVAAAQAPRIVATLQFPAPLVLTGVLATDLDGDGVGDLVVAVRHGERGRRELRVHRGRDAAAHGTAFANEPSLPPLPVERDVIAFTVVDCRPEPGRELVLLTHERAVAVQQPASGEPVYTALSEHRLVWPAADPDFVLPLPDARCDFDGDGKDDLLLPTADGALLQSLHVPARRCEWALPPWRSPLTKGKNGGVSLQDGNLSLAFAAGGSDDADAESKRPLVTLRTRTPRSRLVDVDGDGTLELLTVRNGQRLVGRIADGAATTTTTALPLPGDRLALFDPMFDAQFVDVDGDRRLDLVLTTSARRDDEVEVRIDLFRSAADGTWPKKPDSRLRLQTLARPAQLVDADGDGKLDVVVATVRTDALRMPGSEAPKSLEAQLHVFRGDGTRFVQPALLAERLQLPTGGDRGTLLRALAGKGGTPGALLLTSDDQLQLRPFTRDGERLRLGEASGGVALPAKARFAGNQNVDDDGDEDDEDEDTEPGDGDVLVRTNHELLVVRLP
jgi:hypothetical protein